MTNLEREKERKKESEVTHSCPTLCDPMDCSLARLFHPWDFPGKHTGVGCHFPLQEIFPTQGLNPGLPHCRQMLYHLSHQRKPRQCIKKQGHSFADKGPYSQSYGFPVVMYGCESWTIKNWYFLTVVLEKIPDSLLDSKEDQTSQPLRKSTLNIHWKDWCWSWSWSFNTWPSDVKSCLIGKDPEVGKDWW